MRGGAEDVARPYDDALAQKRLEYRAAVALHIYPDEIGLVEYDDRAVGHPRQEPLYLLGRDDGSGGVVWVRNVDQPGALVNTLRHGVEVVGPIGEGNLAAGTLVQDGRGFVAHE